MRIQGGSQGDVIANIDTLEANTDGLEAGIGTPADAATTTTAAGSLTAMLRQLKNLFLSGTGGYVNLITGQVGVAANAGAPSATTIRTVRSGPSTSTPTSVASVTTAGGVSISAGAAGNLGRIITNTDANTLYLYFGATGTVTSAIYHVALATNQTLILQPGEYTGIISGIWGADGSGSAYVAEFTA